jgi:hypothetical protein
LSARFIKGGVGMNHEFSTYDGPAQFCTISSDL